MAIDCIMLSYNCIQQYNISIQFKFANEIFQVEKPLFLISTLLGLKMYTIFITTVVF